MRRRLLLAAALAAAAAAWLAPGASASRYLQVGIFDDAEILYGNPDRVFPQLQQLGVQVIRVNLWWGGPTPIAVAKRRPTQPANPNDRVYDWATYDRTVIYASRFGMKVLFSILGTPSWANGNAGWNVAPRNAIDLRRFAQAAQRRYSGTFIGPDGNPLPRVDRWLVWNEPNNPVFLKPQFKRVGGRVVVQSARDYARMCNAVVDGIKATLRAAKVACGGTAPRGNNIATGARASTSPLVFMRAFKAAGGRGFDAYAHHPYYGSKRETPNTPPPPGARGQPTTAATLGNFSTFTKELTRLFGNKRIWITEYAYQVNPPDRVFGVTQRQQAQYLQEAYAKLRAHPKVDLFLWFLLRDERRPEGWQSGLMKAGGGKRPAWNAFATLRTGASR